MTNRAFLCVALLATTVMPQTVFALDVRESASDDVLSGEIIVTARKREEALQDVPLSISVFADDDIRAADLRSLQDVATMTPGFQFVGMGFRSPGRYETQLQFRGLTTAQISPSFATGALFIDGQYVLSIYMLDFVFTHFSFI